MTHPQRSEISDMKTDPHVQCDFAQTRNSSVPREPCLAKEEITPVQNAPFTPANFHANSHISDCYNVGSSHNAVIFRSSSQCYDHIHMTTTRDSSRVFTSYPPMDMWNQSIGCLFVNLLMNVQNVRTVSFDQKDTHCN